MTLGLTCEGALWSTGRAVSLLGNGRRRMILDTTEFRRVDVENDARFCEVCVGSGAALARTVDGELYRWGIAVSLSSVKNVETPGRDEALFREHVVGRHAYRELDRTCALAVCMASHARLGRGSWLYVLDQEILRKIVQEYAGSVPLQVEALGQ